MKALYLAPALLLLPGTYACGQATAALRQEVYGAVSRMCLPDGLGLPTDAGYWYQIGYQRPFQNERVAAKLELGYRKSRSSWHVAELAIDFTGRPTQRLTLDALLAYDLLKFPRHALRLAAGPSLWHYEDDELASYSLIRSSDGIITGALVWWQSKQGLTAGGQLRTEYEYQMTPKVSLGARGGLAVLSYPGGLTSIIGLSAGYRL